MVKMTDKGITNLSNELSCDGLLQVELITKLKKTNNFTDMFQSIKDYLGEMLDRLKETEEDLIEILESNDRDYFEKFSKHYGLKNTSFEDAKKQFSQQKNTNNRAEITENDFSFDMEKQIQQIFFSNVYKK